MSNCNLKVESYWQLSAVFCVTALILFMPDFASASSGSNAIACTLYHIQSQLTGAIGKGIATIAVVVLGIGLFLGKLSWGLAIATAMGIGLIFSAGSIVSWLGGANATGTMSC